jgi:hypothetical protein
LLNSGDAKGSVNPGSLIIMPNQLGFRGDGMAIAQPRIASPAAGPSGVWLKLGVVLAAGALVAWWGPHDRLFDLAASGSAPGRLVLLAVLAAIGAAAARGAGLSLDSQGLKRPIATALLVSLAAAAICAGADLLFKPVLNPQYLASFKATSLIDRLIIQSMRAVFEGLVYRLFLGSVLVWLIGRVWKGADGRIAPGAYWAGFALAQMANIALNMAGFMPLNALTLGYYAVRFLLPGVVWGRLYQKHGFITNEMAVFSVHLFFQPLATGLLLGL